MKKLDKDIFQRYASGKYSLKDERYLMDRFGDEASLTELEEVMHADWNQMTDINERKDLSEVLNQIHAKIQPVQKERVIIRIYRNYARVAAVLLLPIAILFALQFYGIKNENSSLTLTSIHAPIGSNVEFTLPDGTHGWLKGGSELSYELAFTQRHVALKGEAYFDVTHDEKRPFEVSGSESKIVVLGTKFSADMWPDKNTTEVILESGKVKFVVENNGESTILKPGQRLVYHRGHDNVAVEPVLVQEANAWVNGVLVFRGEDLKDVADKLSKWYNIDIVLDENYSKDFHFRATFKNESIEEVLRLMKMTAPISYQIIDRKKLSDGTYSKGKVILKMKK